MGGGKLALFLRDLTNKDILSSANCLFIYLFGFLRCFQHCTGHITTDSWKGRGNQYIQFVRVLYCKLPTNGKQLPAYPLETVRGSNPGLRGGKQECYHSATVAPISKLCNITTTHNVNAFDGRDGVSYICMGKVVLHEKFHI